MTHFARHSFAGQHQDLIPLKEENTLRLPNLSILQIPSVKVIFDYKCATAEKHAPEILTAPAAIPGPSGSASADTSSVRYPSLPPIAVKSELVKDEIASRSPSQTTTRTGMFPSISSQISSLHTHTPKLAMLPVYLMQTKPPVNRQVLKAQ